MLFNNADTDLAIFSDGREHGVKKGESITIEAPTDEMLRICANGKNYEFSMPFSPRPHSINEYIEPLQLLVQIEIATPAKLIIKSQSGGGSLLIYGHPAQKTDW